MTSALPFRYLEKSDKGVWLGLLFYPERSNSQDYYLIRMMFHRNKSIVEAYIDGNQDIIERFRLLVTGSGDFSNLRWAFLKLYEVMEQTENGTQFRFFVPNDRLARIYRYWIAKRDDIKYAGNEFLITNTHSKLHSDE